MLENYFDGTSKTETEAQKKFQRLAAVQAALEIAKHSVGPGGEGTHSRVDEDLEFVTSKIEALADAIQKALSKNID
ncbi:hypothetical protein [Klebsiella sp. WP8-S18-ESBL-06]|uniref:hypothetical protein n=1 Tax=Klebsiella sp. WP8-S18-ESBL-06 TaxID=2675726 RepID=UPI0015DC60FB|nr:hypothetical protein [Klebsiella sp. WP8-S18-ESBL-06]BBT71283.1 hypothetical protein WP8S18E06_25820 [Klebsiella sp. WP8-S18-ESBL-06]